MITLAASFVREWGPSLLIVFSALLFFWVMYKERGKVRKSQDPSNLTPVLRSGGGFEKSILDAEEMNSYRLIDHAGPSVRLSGVARFSPSEYRAAAHLISERFREGRVVSIDFGKMDPNQAARLVDFCSGMLAFSSGWVFRVTDKVIILTPPE
ncbi:cell division protein SepF [Nocardiopsis alborubida]|nr:cell division protein SepF [Nocardiopsis alborubida]